MDDKLRESSNFVGRSVQKLWSKVQNLRDNWPLTLHTLRYWCPRQSQGVVDFIRVDSPEKAGIINGGGPGIITHSFFSHCLVAAAVGGGEEERERVSTLAAVLLDANGHTNSKT